MDEIAQLKQELAELKAQKHELELGLADSTNKFDILFDKSLDVILIIDIESGQILDVNETAKQILGYDKDSLVKQNFSILFPESGDDANEVESFFMHDISIAQEFLKADGSVVPMDLTFTIIPWQSSEAAVLITLRDVTERRQAEIEQQRLIEELDAFAHTV
ncbi:MAG: PAS domain S-box protein, partial [Chloroflexota bacterium]